MNEITEIKAIEIINAISRNEKPKYYCNKCNKEIENYLIEFKIKKLIFHGVIKTEHSGIRRISFICHDEYLTIETFNDQFRRIYLGKGEPPKLNE